MRACHQSEQRQKIKGKQRNGDMLRDQAEERGRNAKANVSERHLHTDHGLRFISAEDIGCHMNDTGINGCATETDDDKADQRKQGGKRKEDQKNARYDDTESRADQKTVAEFHGKKAVYASARRNPDIEKARKARGDLGRDPFVQHEIAACPQGCGKLKRAIAEEGQKTGNSARNGEDLFEFQGLVGAGFRRIGRCAFCVFP